MNLEAIKSQIEKMADEALANAIGTMIEGSPIDTAFNTGGFEALNDLYEKLTDYSTSLLHDESRATKIEILDQYMMSKDKICDW